MLIETTTTPNPATLKFLPGRAVMASGTHDFVSADAAETSPLAAALFSLSDVTRVFYGGDFISVTAVQGADWRDIKPQVLGVLLDHFEVAGHCSKPAVRYPPLRRRLKTILPTPKFSIRSRI